jgi:hypothetical protein
VLSLVKQIANAVDYFMGLQSFLYLRKPENDRNKPGNVDFCFNCAFFAKLKAVESNIDQVSIKEQVLAHVVSEDDHEGLDQTVSHVHVH